MIEMSLESDPLFYRDYEACLKFLEELCDCSCKYPEEVTNFHVYTEVRTDKELECIEFFLIRCLVYAFKYFLYL